MLTMFNYNRDAHDNSFNDIIDGIGALVREQHLGITDRAKYDENNKVLNENIVKYALTGTRFQNKYEAEGMSVLKNPNVSRNSEVRANFDAIVVEVITSAIPVSTSKEFGDTFMDIRQIGWGDTARFKVTSNDLFRVNEIAEGVSRGVLQPIYNNEFTVDASPITISTSIDFYAVAAGEFDWGDFGVRAGTSFNAYIMLKAIAALATAVDGQSAPYKQGGVTTKAWANLVSRVSAANGGSSVYVMGTLASLAECIPQTVGLQYGLGDKIAADGHLDKYIGAKLIPFDQFIKPGTVNSTADLPLDDDKLYFIPTDAYKPVKVVYEGNSVTVETDPTKTTDRTYGITVSYRVGVAGIIGSKIGCIELP